MTPKKLQNIISQGEGLKVEFKNANNKLPNNLFESVCAFLNKSGVDDMKSTNNEEIKEW